MCWVLEPQVLFIAANLCAYHDILRHFFTAVGLAQIYSVGPRCLLLQQGAVLKNSTRLGLAAVDGSDAQRHDHGANHDVFALPY